MTNLLLAFHLLGAVCFFVGGIVVGVLQLKAIRQERPSQVYALLRRAPFGAALVGTGALLTLGFGIALAEHEGIGLKPAWIQVSLGLWVAAMVLGALGGRTARHARHLAEKLAEEGDAPSPELRAMVGARGPLLASLASFDLLLAIVVLMVWQPGQPEQPSSYRRFELSAKLEGKIVAAHPRFAYIPTRLPRGLRFFTYDSRLPYLELSFFGSGPAGSAFIDYSVSQAQCGMSRKPPDRGTFSVNGYLLGWDRSSGRWSVRRCVKEGNDSLVIEADSLSDRWGRADLATIVAYAAPLN